ncbi:MAG TPA: putative aminohydrolase SsnA [Anaerolineaceae bacterium]|nr:putative aminohydrolase SsnA [Anaerolineaceae bacterium]
MLIKNAIIITWEQPNRILEGHAVLVRDSLIQRIAPQADLESEYPHEPVIDAHGQLLMPGVICAHTHFYGAFSRGMAIPPPAPSQFSEILEKLWWPLDQSLDLQDVKVSAEVCLIDAIKHGTTTLFDHHASPNAIDGSLDMIRDAFDETGLRGVVCYEVTDRGGVNKAEAGIAENLRMIKSVNEGNNLGGRLAATFGMHAGLTLTDETLRKCQEAIGSNTGIHIHVAEHQVDEFDSLEKYGMRVIDRLQLYGFLGDRSIVAHGVHMDMREAEILANTKTWLAHQPRSNSNNAVGLADVESMLRLGVRVCIGNDGLSNAMWDEWRSCYLAHKLTGKDPRKMSGDKVIEMGVYNNAELAAGFFPSTKSLGTIQEGAPADLILVDYDPITEMTTGNLPWQILFGFRDSMVTMTMVAGKALMLDRKLTEIDERQVFAEARERSKIVWKRYQEQF